MSTTTATATKAHPIAGFAGRGIAPRSPARTASAAAPLDQSRASGYARTMLLDAHTHVFPPAFVQQRDDLAREEPLFAALYADPAAKLATPPELLAAVQRNVMDAAVALGISWRSMDRCRAHNDALLSAAAESGGRIIPFCTVAPAAPAADVRRELERCARAGARGVGELRTDASGGFDGAAGATLAACAEELGLVLLFHASEPVGHLYPGKGGGDLGALWRFVAAYPRVRVVLAHWGGGLPFYALMPEVRAALGNIWFDTAATTLLYAPAIYRAVIDLVGAERVLFGSDFPLLGPRRQLRALADAPLTAEERALIAGDNAARLLGLA